MANLSEDIQCVGSDTRPPMLDRTDFASWQQRIRLYWRGKENGVNILKSIDEGPFQIGTFRETLAEGNEGALHLGLPKDIYTLINYYTDANDIWDNVKMLLEGSELTKEDMESQLYDDFEHFRQNKGETIHDYYVRFAKLIHDMRNIKMTMSIMQLNSKFVNNMFPEWGRFVTGVKLNRGLRDSNYDQLTSSNIRNQATVQDGRVVVQNVQCRHNRGQANNARGVGAVGYGGALNKVGNANPGQARQIKCYNCNYMGHIARNCTQPKRPQNSKYFKDNMLLMQAQENGVALDEEKLLFIAGGQDNVIDEDVDEQPVQDLALNVDNIFQADDCDAFDSDVDEAPTAHTMFMGNLSSANPVYDEASLSYDSNILSEVPDHDNYQDAVCEHHEVHEMHDDNNVVDNSLTAELATYKEQVELYERRAKFELTEREQKINEQLRIVIADRNRKEENLKRELHSVKLQLTSTINHNKSMVEEVTSLKKDFKQKENKYLEEFLDMKALKEKVKDKLYKQDQSLQTVHMCVNQSPIMMNRIRNLFSDFQHPQKQWCSPTEQIFWSKDLIKMKAEALKEQTTASRPIKALMMYPPNTPATLVPQLEAEVDQNVVNRKHDEIERKNLLIANDNLIADCLALDFQITQLTDKVTVLQEQNELFRTENAKIKQHYKELYDSIKITRAKHIKQITALLTENKNLKAQIQENLKCITMDSIEPRVLATGRYAIDVEPILPRNRKNREVHLDYLKHLKESVETLREIVEEAKVERPLDSSLAFACLYTKHSQELLEYVLSRTPMLIFRCLSDFGDVTDWYQEPRIMPPKIFKKKSIKRLVEKCVAKAIKEYEKDRAVLKQMLVDLDQQILKELLHQRSWRTRKSYDDYLNIAQPTKSKGMEHELWNLLT
ncbi:retrovirus-related pol polyprotein from transposon TNT 1-94 [Tanacetum coccineum]